MPAFAVLTTWTVYGTWLPGDARGHVSNILPDDGGFVRAPKAFGAPPGKPDESTRSAARRRQRYPTLLLNPVSAGTAAQALLGAASSRNWRILRAAVMVNHVHVVTVDCPDDGPGVRRVLKGISQRCLCEAYGVQRRWWTAGGSDRYLHDEQAVAAAVRYTANQARKLAEIVDHRIIDPP